MTPQERIARCAMLIRMGMNRLSPTEAVGGRKIIAWSQGDFTDLSGGGARYLQPSEYMAEVAEHWTEQFVTKRKLTDETPL